MIKNKNDINYLANTCAVCRRVLAKRAWVLTLTTIRGSFFKVSRATLAIFLFSQSTQSGFTRSWSVFTGTGDVGVRALGAGSSIYIVKIYTSQAMGDGTLTGFAGILTGDTIVYSYGFYKARTAGTIFFFGKSSCSQYTG